MGSTPDRTALTREARVRDVLLSYFSREVTRLETLGSSNNFVYHVHLSPNLAVAPQPQQAQQPGTTVLVSTTTDVVLRMSNPDAMVTEANRIQHEVAAMVLMRQALACSGLDHLVPLVYGWEPPETDVGHSGWILMEHKNGTALDTVFPTFNMEKKEKTLLLVAHIFKAIQQYVPPDSLKAYGGLTFNTSGDIVAGPLTILGEGPFTSLAALHQRMMYKQLELSDSSQGVNVNGWRNTSIDLRQRLERFAAEGLVPLVQRNSISRPTLVHGDLDIQNVLVDVENDRLSALLDFDFTHIASVADEYMLSFMLLGGILPGPFEDGDFARLREFQLLGSSGVAAVQPTKGDVDWDVAVAFDRALEQAGVLRVQDISGIDEYSALIWFLQDVYPPYFTMPRWLKRRTPEQVESQRLQIETSLDK